MRKCKLGSRHKWVFQHNVQITRINGNRGSVSLRGLYKCQCGEQKQGSPGVSL